MPAEGFVEYRRREFCRDVRCPVQALLDGEKEGSARYEKVRAVCGSSCIRSAHEFHRWLTDRGFLILKPNKD